MKRKTDRKAYVQSFGEEVGNSVSHGVMTIAALCGLPLAAIRGYLSQGVEGAVCASVFVISLLFMFLGSTLYHSMAPNSRHKAVFHILDHIFIFVAIAGTYTPVAVSVIGGWQGWVIVAVQWVMVLFGILYKSLSRRSIPALSLSIYLIMGWTIVFFFPLFIRRASIPMIVLIGLGGLFYTLGAWFYARKGFKYHHLVWHLLINLAAVSHYVAIVFYLY